MVKKKRTKQKKRITNTSNIEANHKEQDELTEDVVTEKETVTKDVVAEDVVAKDVVAKEETVTEEPINDKATEDVVEETSEVAAKEETSEVAAKEETSEVAAKESSEDKESVEKKVPDDNSSFRQKLEEGRAFIESGNNKDARQILSGIVSNNEIPLEELEEAQSLLGRIEMDVRALLVGAIAMLTLILIPVIGFVKALWILPALHS